VRDRVNGTSARQALAGGRFPLAKELSMPPFRLQQIDHVVLRVHDLAAMLAFYCDVLGCTEERRQDAIGLMQLRAGTSLIDLVPLDSKLGRLGGAGPGREGHNMDHLCLSVEGYDEQAIVAHLKTHGVRVGDIGSRYGAQGEGPSIYCYDPQGNMVELKGPPAASN
jgi:glyoxylase I family protein